jgi:hypothetical protein
MLYKWIFVVDCLLSLHIFTSPRTLEVYLCLHKSTTCFKWLLNNVSLHGYTSVYHSSIKWTFKWSPIWGVFKHKADVYICVNIYFYLSWMWFICWKLDSQCVDVEGSDSVKSWAILGDPYVVGSVPSKGIKVVLCGLWYSSHERVAILLKTSLEPPKPPWLPVWWCDLFFSCMYSCHHGAIPMR